MFSRKTYIKLGGDGIYAVWQLTYLEPAFRQQRFRAKDYPTQHLRNDGYSEKTGLYVAGG